MKEVRHTNDLHIQDMQFIHDGHASKVNQVMIVKYMNDVMKLRGSIKY